ncbi:MAG: RNA 2',3'-cyclic phosphodiesterase [Acidimicrobiales bacterium]
MAVWPPPDVVERLAALPRPTRAGLRWTTAAQWHVTLRFLGAVDDAKMAPLAEALAAATSQPPVTAVAGPALTRLGQAVLCLPVAGLDPLAATVVARSAAIGESAGDRPFRGHLTIARAGRGVDPRPRPPVPFSATWAVEEVTLVASTLRREGARYEVVSRFPLGKPSG